MSSYDLRALEAEVELVRDQLARLEQERADLVNELHDFELLYNARVGPLQARLETAQLHLREYQLRIELLRLRRRSLSPSQLDGEVEYRLRDQRQRAEATAAAADEAWKVWQNKADEPADPTGQLDLKQVYRELAKRVHPDLASDSEERVSRGARMAEINSLYAQKQIEALRKILREVSVDHRPPPETPEQRRQRLLSEQARLEVTIRSLKAEIADLNRSPMMLLKLEYALKRSRGQDSLKDVARRLTTQLEETESQLRELTIQFRELANSLRVSDE